MREQERRGKVEAFVSGLSEYRYVPLGVMWCVHSVCVYFGFRMRAGLLCMCVHICVCLRVRVHACPVCAYAQANVCMCLRLRSVNACA